MDKTDSYCGEYSVLCPGGKGILNVTKDGAYYLFRLNAPHCGEVLHLYCINSDAVVSIGVPYPADGSLTLSKRVSRTLLAPLGGMIGFCALADTPEAALALVSPPAAEAAAPDLPKEAEEVFAGADEDTDFAPEREETTVQEAAEVYSDEAYPSLFVSADGAAEETDHEKDIWAAASDWVYITDGRYEGLDADSGAMHRQHNGCVQVAIPISDDRPFPIPSLLRWGVPTDISGVRHLLFRAEEGKLTVI